MFRLPWNSSTFRNGVTERRNACDDGRQSSVPQPNAFGRLRYCERIEWTPVDSIATIGATSSLSMLQIIVFELAVLIGIAGHFSNEPAIRGIGWVLMTAFIVGGFVQAGAP